VHIDYHVSFDGHFYSVPHSLVGEPVRVRATDTTVEIYHKSQRVASHLRSSKRGGYTTVPAHMPKAHQKQRDFSPGRLLNWAATVGPHTASLCHAILDSHRHPEHGYKSCLGLMRLGQRYAPERLEAACARAFAAGARSYQSVKTILENGLDRIPMAPQQPPAARIEDSACSNSMRFCRRGPSNRAIRSSRA